MEELQDGGEVCYALDFSSEGSNPSEWALGNAFTVVLRARKKERLLPYVLDNNMLVV